MVPFSPRFCSLALKSTFLSENIIIWVKTLPYFTPMMIFSPNTSFWTKKRWHLMTFSWRLESERTRVRVKSNHKFRAYGRNKVNCGCFSFPHLFQTQKKNPVLTKHDFFQFLFSKLKMKLSKLSKVDKIWLINKRFYTVVDYRPFTVRLQLKTLLPCILLLTSAIKVQLR